MGKAIPKSVFMQYREMYSEKVLSVKIAVVRKIWTKPGMFCVLILVAPPPAEFSIGADQLQI